MRWETLSTTTRRLRDDDGLVHGTYGLSSVEPGKWYVIIVRGVLFAADAEPNNWCKYFATESEAREFLLLQATLNKLECA